MLDLGSGAGIDCFLAAKKVGSNGRVIGVDMTSEMVSRARKNAENSRFKNVEFRLGEIEALPVEDSSIDLIISNCVINLSPTKGRVFREAWRVLKPGGRLVVSDLVAAELPSAQARQDMDLYSACISGAEEASTIELLLKESDFLDVSVQAASAPFDWGDGDKPRVEVYSATIRGTKPNQSK